MPARLRIVALLATLALAAPVAALAQSGGGGAGASQNQDPFGSSAPSKPSAATLPRTGFDVLPVAAAGVVPVLGGVALWRRPHADR